MMMEMKMKQNKEFIQWKNISISLITFLIIFNTLLVLTGKHNEFNQAFSIILVFFCIISGVMTAIKYREERKR
jgi:phosphatidylglycerophosphate synthase